MKIPSKIKKGPLKITLFNDLILDIDNNRYIFKPKVAHSFKNNKLTVTLSYKTNTKEFFMKAESTIAINIKLKSNITKF